MKDIKFKAYVYDLTDEDSHPLEIDLRAGRLLGWLRSPAEAGDELNMKEAEARQYFGKLVEGIPMNSIKMLVA